MGFKIKCFQIYFVISGISVVQLVIFTPSPHPTFAHSNHPGCPSCPPPPSTADSCRCHRRAPRSTGRPCRSHPRPPHTGVPWSSRTPLRCMSWYRPGFWKRDRGGQEDFLHVVCVTEQESCVAELCLGVLQESKLGQLALQGRLVVGHCVEPEDDEVNLGFLTLPTSGSPGCRTRTLPDSPRETGPS